MDRGVGTVGHPGVIEDIPKKKSLRVGQDSKRSSIRRKDENLTPQTLTNSNVPPRVPYADEHLSVATRRSTRGYWEIRVAVHRSELDDAQRQALRGVIDTHLERASRACSPTEKIRLVVDFMGSQAQVSRYVYPGAA